MDRHGNQGKRLLHMFPEQGLARLYQLQVRGETPGRGKGVPHRPTQLPCLIATDKPTKAAPARFTQPSFLPRVSSHTVHAAGLLSVEAEVPAQPHTGQHYRAHARTHARGDSAPTSGETGTGRTAASAGTVSPRRGAAAFRAGHGHQHSERRTARAGPSAPAGPPGRLRGLGDVGARPAARYEGPPRAAPPRPATITCRRRRLTSSRRSVAACGGVAGAFPRVPRGRS